VCNRLVRDIIEANDPARIRLINCGVKAFTRQAKEGGRATELRAAPENALEDPGAGRGVIGDGGVPSVGDEKDLVFRFVYEGVEALLPYVDPAFILVAGLKELRRMLEVYYPTLTDFEDSFAGQISRTSMSILLVLQSSVCMTCCYVDLSAGGAHLVRFESGEYDGAMYVHEHLVALILLIRPVIVPVYQNLLRSRYGLRRSRFR